MAYYSSIYTTRVELWGYFLFYIIELEYFSYLAGSCKPGSSELSKLY